MRVVKNSDQNQGSTSSAAGSNNNGQQQAQQNAQVSQAQSATQYRVSQISCHFGDSNASEESQPVVFDLRQAPISPCSSKSVRVFQQFFIGDDVEHARFHGDVRVLVEEVSDWDDGELKSILLDSGADAAVFPKEYATAGMASNMPDLQLHDAQGRQIPVMGMRDVEVHLTDETGRQVVLREHVAISSSVHQPILCFGRLMENGWGVNASEQNLVHATGVKIPIELQNKSMVVKGSIRAISCDEGSGEHPGQASVMVRAVKATVRDDVLHGHVGWSLDETGLGIGRHFAETYQDPTLVCPAMQGVRNRTTLIKGDDGFWYVVELCEPLQSLIDMSAEFYGYSGAREVLTFVTEGEKSPGSMGFSMREDAADLPAAERQDEADQQDPDAIAPEDEVRGRDIGNQDSLMPSADGREIPADRVVVNAADFEKVIVNGVELTVESSLAALRSGCSFYGISQSGGKMKCYGRLVNHLKKLELELLKDAAQHAAAELERKPHSPTLAVPPSEEAQRQHELTHTPYQSWCESCICFKARANRQLRDDSSRASETPTVSFDLAFTRSIPEGVNPQDVSALPFLVMVDSASGYVGCVPLRSKGQLELMTREVLSFTAGLGHAEVIFRCDNEPTMRQLLKYVVSTRLSMGLATRSVTPPAYSHGNSLVENVIGRLRPLASILMHSVRKRTGMDFSTNHALWTWAHRHAAWLMNRYGVVRNVTPFELVHKKHYTGSIAQFAEPVFGYFRVGAKASEGLTLTGRGT